MQKQSLIRPRSKLFLPALFFRLGGRKNGILPKKNLLETVYLALPMTNAKNTRRGPKKLGTDFLAALIISVPLALAPIRTHAARPKHFIGPMAHWNYGGGISRFSISLEGSYWFHPTKTPVPLGIDYALEWQAPGVWRIYAEAQTGILLLGYSAGPVLEFGPGRLMPGLQGTMWVNMFLGVDIRGRLMAVGPHSYGNGVYLKVPIDGDRESLVIE